MRRMSTTSGSRRVSGRFANAAIHGRTPPCHRNVPVTISPASARSRSSCSPDRTRASAVARSTGCRLSPPRPLADTRSPSIARSASYAATRAGAIMGFRVEHRAECDALRGSPGPTSCACLQAEARARAARCGFRTGRPARRRPACTDRTWTASSATAEASVDASAIRSVRVISSRSVPEARRHERPGLQTPDEVVDRRCGQVPVDRPSSFVILGA